MIVRYRHLGTLGLASVLVACSTAAKVVPKTKTTEAELRVIRRGVTVAHQGESVRAPYQRERLGEGATVNLEGGGLAWIRRDEGSTMLVRGPGQIEVEDDHLDIKEGRVFAEASDSEPETVETPSGDLVLSAVRTSIDVSKDATEAYVLEGELRAGTIVAHAGERLRIDAKGATVSPQGVWEDWTGGLATSSRDSEPAPYGVGTIGARRPGVLGEPFAPMTIQRLDVRVEIRGDLAVTEVDQTFFNPLSETVEGVYRMRTPEHALLDRFGVDRDGGILYGFVKEKAQAAAQYQANVYAGSTENPALLEWSGPNEYQARIYPIAPGETRRIVVRYSEWLGRSGAHGERRLYTYPMAFEGTEASAPTIEDLSIEINVAGAGLKKAPTADDIVLKTNPSAVRVDDVIVFRDHDVVPRADFSVELFDDGGDAIHAVRAKHVTDTLSLGPEELKDGRRTAAGEAEYFMVPVRAAAAPPAEEGLDLVLVVDGSAATDEAMMRAARGVVRSVMAHLGDHDRLEVLVGDEGLREVIPGAGLQKATPEHAKKILESLAQISPGGATDLSAMLFEGSKRLPDGRKSALVYVGDGQPTVGETHLGAIRERLKKAPRQVRTYGLGIGDGANMALLEGLSTSGFSARIGDERAAAKAALRLLESADRAVSLGTTIDLGTGVERIYPKELGALSAEDTTWVVGRITGESPKEITLSHGADSVRIPLVVSDQDGGDLRRRWAMGRLGDLFDEKAGHAALVDLGVRQGIITPVTSIYVPTSKEMTPQQRESIDRRRRKRTEIPAVKASPVREEEEKEQGESKGMLDGLLDGRKSERATTAAQAAATSSPAAEAAPDVTLRKKSEAAEGRGAPEAEAPSEPAAAAEFAANRDGAAPASPAPVTASVEPNQVLKETASALEAAKNDRSNVQQGIVGLGVGGGGKATGVGDGFGNGTGSLGGTHLPDPPAARIPGRPPRVMSRPVDSENKDQARDEQGFGGGNGRFDKVGFVDAGGTRRATLLVIDDPGRIFQPCGHAKDVPFEERKALWRERLSATGGQAHLVAAVIRRAFMSCETPTTRERRALILMGVDHLPTITQRVSLMRNLAPEKGASDVIYRAILSRIATPEDVRELNQALGIASVDPGELEKVLKEAKTPEAKVAALRGLSVKFPGDKNLALHLLFALEDSGDLGAARTLAKSLRDRSDADTRIRTEVGELYFRLAARSEENRAEDLREAKGAFGEIVEFSPDDPTARRRLGDLYRAHGLFAEATRQYETLGALVPDDPAVPLLLALSANGLGKLEEAVKWSEKGSKLGSPDLDGGPHATAQALASLFLGLGRLEAADKPDERKALADRLARLVPLDKRAGQVHVLLAWSHPEVRPTLWTDALGSMTPATRGDLTLGIAEGWMPLSAKTIEVRLDPTEIEHAARLGAKAELLVLFDEGKDTERIEKRTVTFERDAKTTRFSVGERTVTGESK